MYPKIALVVNSFHKKDLTHRPDDWFFQKIV